MQLNPLDGLRELTNEINLFSKEHAVIQSGHVYEDLTRLVDEHQRKIQGIFTNCIGHPELLIELNNYTASIYNLQQLLPPLRTTNEKVTNVVQLKLLSIRKKINETQVIHQMATAFKLSSSELINLIKRSTATHLSEQDINGLESSSSVAGSLEPFFVKAADVCFSLANQRLMQPRVLDSQEVKAIYEVLSSPHLLEFNREKMSDNPISQPHPLDVFKSLHTFFASIEALNSCHQMLDQVEIYLANKPNPSQGLVMFLNLPKTQQTRLLDMYRIQAVENEKIQAFLNDLQSYQNQLNTFKNGLRDFPIINVRALMEDSMNINQTFFLNANQKIQWVFKPISENAKGEEIVQAECTASRLNYHRQFPIPLTIHLKIKEWEGSAQLYVENARTMTQIEREGIPISKKELQRLAIFDLLFANSDRNSANFLFQVLGDRAKIIGIDHDSCLMVKDIRALRLEYLNLDVLEEPLEEETAELFSNEALDRYKRVMQENGISGQQIEWMQSVAEDLNDALIVQTPLDQIIRSIQEKYESEYLS